MLKTNIRPSPFLRRFLRLLALLCLLVSCSGPLSAQVAADFTASSTVGCSPLNVQFSDLSTGTITSRNWDFGNGNVAIGNNPSPTAIYTTPGSYTVKLVVSDGVAVDSIVKLAYITVLQEPSVSFTAGPATQGCPPLSVQFTNTTPSGSAPFTNWAWDYGDGSPLGTTTNASHNYTQPGTYTVALTVTDANGCTGSTNVPGLITVNAIPNVWFTATPTSSCQPPLTVNFTNQSSSSTGGNLTFLWDFGGTGTSTLANPTHTFTTAGLFDVTLIATDPQGCSDTLTFGNFISTNGVVADFVASDDTICPGGTINFLNITTGAGQFIWDFGDGSPTSGVANPNHTYTTPGSYTVTLTANGGSCSGTATFDIVVDNVQANFTSAPNYNCESPLITQYTDLSVPTPASWLWLFGNGFSSTLQNPINTINLEGVFDDTLVVVSPGGCRDTMIIPENTELFILTPEFLMDPPQGCAPLTVNFTDESDPFDSIATWNWQFGDSLGTSVQQNPSFTFVDTGAHPVTLTITTPTGCIYEYVDTVYIGVQQNAFFTWDTVLSCASDTINFYDQSSDTNLIDAYVWNFNDTAGASGKFAQHSFNDTGWMSVELIVTYNGCPDTHTVDSAVYILGPFTTFKAIPDCSAPTNRDFDGTILGATRWYWDFGDSTTIDSTSTDPNHTYPGGGAYLARLEAYNDTTGCAYTHEAYVTVYALEAQWTLTDTVGCNPFTLTVDGSSSVDANTHKIFFGPGLPTSQYVPDTTYTYTSAGFYPLKMVVTDANGCKDSLKQTIRVVEPFADFSSLDTLGCVPLSSGFTDLSFSDTNIVAWQWGFGNGDTAAQQNPTAVYDALGSGFYTVTLTVEDAVGCTASETKNNYIEVRQPPSFFQVNNQLCEGDSVYFNFAPVGVGYTYLWDFDDNMGTSTQFWPRYSWDSAGVYSPTLTVTDSNGCDSTFSAPSVQVQGIKGVGITASPRDSSCYPMPVVFRDTSAAQVSSWQWNFGEGAPPVTVLGPVATNTYNTPGLYDVQLVITTTFGCVDSVLLEDYINVQGPYAEFHISDDTVCIGEPADFLIDSSLNVAGYQWDFGNGLDSVTSGSIDSLTYFYNQTGTIIARMIYLDSGGVCPKSYEDTLFVSQLIADFSIDDPEGCAPHTVQFSDSSMGANVWSWGFGNGQSSNQVSPGMNYDDPGTYSVSLISTNDSTGCRDTTFRQIVVFDQPDPQISGPDFVCIGEWLQLQGSGGVTYAWTPDSLFSDPTSSNTSVWLSQSDTVGLSVTDTNGCVDSTGKYVFVQYPPSFTIAGDTTIFKGQAVDLWIESSVPGNLTAQWVPETGLSCVDCLLPVASPNETTNYTILLADVNGCFSEETSLTVSVVLEQELHIPNAFTPNGDFTNDVLYIVPYGMRKLHHFHIFNRWGDLIFESNDFNQGWDGTHKGKESPIGVYAYSVLAEGYDGFVKQLTGYVVLVR